MSGMMISAHGNRISEPVLTERQLQTRAYRDAVKAIATEIPDPVAYAQYMPLGLVDLLLKARIDRLGWSVPIEAAKILQPYGLVEAGAGARCLTAFGLKVRRALLEEDS